MADKKNNSYVRCASCGEVVELPAVSGAATPCCGHTGVNLLPWPPLPVQKLLETAFRQQRNVFEQRCVAIVFLYTAGELLLENAGMKLMEVRGDTLKASDMIIEVFPGENTAAQLYNKLSDCTLEKLWELKDFIGFMHAWESLAVSRNKIISGTHKDGADEEEETVKAVFNFFHRAFSALHNDVQRQMRKRNIQREKSKTTHGVLIVEDEDQVRAHMVHFFQRQGMRVLATGSGKEAIELYRQRMPDYVFLDVVLTDSDGISVLKTLLTINPRARIYMVTGIDGEAFTKVALSLGARGHFPKPIQLKDLMRVFDE